MGIPPHDRPTCSPDLISIDDVWRTMKPRIKARSGVPATVAEMRGTVQGEWCKLQLTLLLSVFSGHEQGHVDVHS